MTYDVDELRALLGKASSVAEVRRVAANLSVTEFDGVGNIDSRRGGWSLALRTRAGVAGLTVGAVHLYSDGYEGHAAYDGALPGGIAFGEAETEIEKKLGAPRAKGGGVFSKALGQLVPRWLKYPLASDVLHIQLDDDGRANLVTVYRP